MGRQRWVELGCVALAASLLTGWGRPPTMNSANPDKVWTYPSVGVFVHPDQAGGTLLERHGRPLLRVGDERQQVVAALGQADSCGRSDSSAARNEYMFYRKGHLTINLRQGRVTFASLTGATEPCRIPP